MTVEPRPQRRSAPPPTAKENARPSQWAVSARATTKELYSDREWRMLEAAKWEHAATTEATRKALKASLSQSATLCQSARRRPGAHTVASSRGFAEKPPFGAALPGRVQFRRPRLNTAAGCRWLPPPTAPLQVVTDTTQVANRTLGALYGQGQQVQRAQHGVEQVRGRAHLTNCAP